MNKLSKVLATALCLPLTIICAGCLYSSPVPPPDPVPKVHRIGIPMQGEVELKPYNTIKTAGLFNLHINGMPDKGKYKLQINGDKAIVEKVVIKVKNNTLYLSMMPGFEYFETGPVDITVTMRELNKLEYSGSGNISSSNLQSSSLTIQAAGSGNIDLQGIFNLKKLSATGNGRINIQWVDSPKLTVRSVGNSQLFLAGIANNLDMVAADKAVVDAKYLRAKKAFINTAQAARAEVYILDSLNALASGQSNIYYYHKPLFLAPYMRDSGAIISMKNIGAY